MIATSPLPLSASCAIPSLLAVQVACQTDREGQKGNGHDKPHAKETCCLPPVLFCTGTTWKWDLSPQETWKLHVSRAAHPGLCAGPSFFLLFTRQAGRDRAEKQEGEMEGGFSCPLCNFKSYCLHRERSGQSANYTRGAHVPPRAHLHGLFWRCANLRPQSLRFGASSCLPGSELAPRGPIGYMLLPSATGKEGKTLRYKLLPGTPDCKKSLHSCQRSTRDGTCILGLRSFYSALPKRQILRPDPSEDKVVAFPPSGSTKKGI